MDSFKPYYKWITFNTVSRRSFERIHATLYVLNLIINGLPSILESKGLVWLGRRSFKPYYKWITFNTM